MNMKFGVAVLVGYCVLFLGQAGVCGTYSVPEGVEQAATARLAEFLDGVPVGSETAFGFTAADREHTVATTNFPPPPPLPAAIEGGGGLGVVRSGPSNEPEPPQPQGGPGVVSLDNAPKGRTQSSGKLVKARLGEPYPLRVLTPDALARYHGGDDIAPLLAAPKEWLFAVRVEDEVRALLLVARMPEGWRAVSLGYANVAVALNSVRGKLGRDSEHEINVVHVLQGDVYLVNVPELGRDNLTLVSSARKGELTTADVVLPELKVQVEKIRKANQ